MSKEKEEHLEPKQTPEEMTTNETQSKEKAPSSPTEKETPSKDNIDKKIKVIQEKEYTILSEKEALEKIHKGEPLEKNYIESLTLGNSQAKVIYKEKVIFTNCAIGKINFQNTHFEEVLLFESVHFESSVSFERSAHCQGNVSFRSCHFEKSWEAKQVSFPKGLTIVNSKLEGECLLDEVEVQGETRLILSNFQKRLSLRKSNLDILLLHESEFHISSDITDCHIQKKLRSDKIITRDRFILQNVVIEGPASWEKIQAQGGAFQLINCHFQGKVLFNNSSFACKFSSKRSVFERHVSWQGVTFERESAFTESRFERQVCFDQVQFQGAAYFNDAYMENASFHNSIFSAPVSFERLRSEGEFLCYNIDFQDEVKFTFCEMNGRVSFSNIAKFRGKADFYRGTFRGSVWFLGAQFSDVSFANTNFEAQVYFSFDRNTLNERNRRRKKGATEFAIQYASVFQGETNFTNTLFYRKAVFENVFFKKFANFENAYFAEESNFENSHFLEGATFRGSFCSQELNFTKVVFDDYVSFDLSNINRRLNLTDANIDKGISFYHAVIDVVVVEKEQIKNRLIYEGLIPGQKHRCHFMRVKEEYLILKESFNQRGKFDEEDWAYYRYRLNDRRSITQKAWRSLTGKSILAVQDDVPQDEPEDSLQFLENARRPLGNVEKKIQYYERKLEKLEEQETKVTAQEKSDKKEKSLARIRKQRDDIRIQKSEQLKKISSLEEAQKVIEGSIELDQERIKKVHESKEKAYSKIEACGCIFRNIWWKLVDWGTGYGMKPFRIGLLAFAVIVLFAGVFHFSGEAYPGGKITGQFSDWLHFSAMAFATSSPEGDIAYSSKIKFFIMSEALLGLFLMALFVGCYTRKIIR